ncbi:DUF58 domain-containing protein [Clostridium estertheticum]|uniref:DUF58 domain-containing protein n=1 Tax=Clostridium estertheticum TaxID=238834 RepID=UPI0013E978DA|nr:DUF58 domain-containing protein [Clostridium estertheticum]MBZ9685164.1 DUF58 domain-containing protein [Clostridium estertheticum]
MGVKFILIVLISWVMLEISNITKKRGFKKLKIRREIDNPRIFEGEVFSIKTTVENNKRLPISFLVINEVIPKGISFNNEVVSYKYGDNLCHISRYKIGRYERRKRTYELVAQKRGTYILKNIQITVGDIFGLSAESIETENYLEILVYPRLKNMSSYKFDTTSFQGNNTVKRWILKDTLYIKGIREYNVEDRMKDIHWKTSLKMDKLMVKDYDTTSDKELVIILNVQCGDPAWAHIMEAPIEIGIKIAVSLTNKAIKEGIPTGLWTNSRIISMNGNLTGEVAPALNSFKRIMELAARIDSGVRVVFDEYLKQQANKFNKNVTYILVTPFLNEKSICVLNKLCKSGFKLKIIDVSINEDIPFISGIEKITYKGEKIV